MAHRDPPYDPHVAAPSSRIAGIQSEVDEAVTIATRNLGMVNERGENLDILQNKTDNLQNSSNDFRRGVHRVRKQMWWKNAKVMTCIVIGIIILLIVIIVPSVIASRNT